LSTDNNPGNKTTLYECGGDGTHPNAKINASPAGSLIYDVMP